MAGFHSVAPVGVFWLPSTQFPTASAVGYVVTPLRESSMLARHGRTFEIIAFVFMFVTIFLLLPESTHPKLRLRKRPLPKPAIRLNLDGPSN